MAQLPAVDQNMLPRIRPETIPASAPLENSLISLSPKLPVQNLKLPLAYANIKSSLFPTKWKPSDGLVVYIQDVHMNQEAQENIGKSIQQLIDQGNADMVALEGAFEPIDLSRFRSFKDPDAVHQAADYMLRENKISGAIHAAFSSAKPIPSFVGVDDRKLYDGHVGAYKESAGKVETLKKDLAAQESRLEQDKDKTFNPNLLSFDHQVQAYRKGTLPVGEYVKAIAPSLRGEEMISVFLRALAMEKSLDFAQVEKERGALILKLSRELTQPQMSGLLNTSLSYRLGRVRHTDFYVYLKTLCEKEGIHFQNYPAMQSYIQYVLLSDQIKAEKLLEEMKSLEDRTYEKLLKTPAEKDLIAQSSRLHLTQKLVDFALTPDEWREYQASPAPSPRSGEGSNEGGEVNSLSSFESFFEHAALRDQAISANILTQVKEHKSRISVLVTGGYHTEGITKILAKNKTAVITLAPKITKINGKSGTEYLSVFTQEKSPLEKLFDGDKLFVSQITWSNRLHLMFASLVSSLLALGDPQGAQAAFQFLAGPPGANYKLTFEEIKASAVNLVVSGPEYLVKCAVRFGEKNRDERYPAIASVSDISLGQDSSDAAVLFKTAGTALVLGAAASYAVSVPAGLALASLVLLISTFIHFHPSSPLPALAGTRPAAHPMETLKTRFSNLFFSESVTDAGSGTNSDPQTPLLLQAVQDLRDRAETNLDWPKDRIDFVFLTNILNAIEAMIKEKKIRPGLYPYGYLIYDNVRSVSIADDFLDPRHPYHKYLSEVLLKACMPIILSQFKEASRTENLNDTEALQEMLFPERFSGNGKSELQSVVDTVDVIPMLGKYFSSSNPITRIEAFMLASHIWLNANDPAAKAEAHRLFRAALKQEQDAYVLNELKAPNIPLTLFLDDDHTLLGALAGEYSDLGELFEDRIRILLSKRLNMNFKSLDEAFTGFKHLSSQVNLKSVKRIRSECMFRILDSCLEIIRAPWADANLKSRAVDILISDLNLRSGSAIHILPELNSLIQNPDDPFLPKALMLVEHDLEGYDTALQDSGKTGNDLKKINETGHMAAYFRGYLRSLLGFALDSSRPQVQEASLSLILRMAQCSDPDTVNAAKLVLLGVSGELHERLMSGECGSSSRTVLRALLFTAQKLQAAHIPGAERMIEQFVFESKAFEENPPVPLPRSRRWMEGAESLLRKKMPTLSSVLSDPARSARFLTVLSALRIAHPYHLSNRSKFGPIEWSQREEAVYRLRELNLVPVSQSFRRHILYADNADGSRFAIQIKMPGEEKDRDEIRPVHFTLSRKLWKQSPENPGIVKPLFMMGWSGDFHFYGAGRGTLSFSAKNPLRIVAFEYRDGRRLAHDVERLARDAATPEGLNRFREAAAAVIGFLVRVHRMGYRAVTERGNDGHLENWILYPSGKVESVADLGAFEKRRKPITRKERRDDMSFALTHFGLTDDTALVSLPEVAASAVRHAMLGYEESGTISHIIGTVMYDLGMNEDSMPEVMKYVRRIAPAFLPALILLTLHCFAPDLQAWGLGTLSFAALLTFDPPKVLKARQEETDRKLRMILEYLYQHPGKGFKKADEIFWAQARDEGADPTLIWEIGLAAVQNLVHKQALKHKSRHPSSDLEEILQELSITVGSRIKRFDPSKSKWSTYVMHAIQHENHIQNVFQGVIHVPKHFGALHGNIKRVIAFLEEELGRVPTLSEIAKWTAMDAAEVQDILANGAASVVSLEKPLPGSKAHEEGSLLAETIAHDPDGVQDAYAQTVNESTVAKMLTHLPLRSALILRLNFGRHGVKDEETMRQISGPLNVTEARIRQIRNASIQELRKQASNKNLPIYFTETDMVYAENLFHQIQEASSQASKDILSARLKTLLESRSQPRTLSAPTASTKNTSARARYKEGDPNQTQWQKFMYRFYTTVGVNWEAVYQAPVLAFALAQSFFPVYAAAMIPVSVWMAHKSAYRFSGAHKGKTPQEAKHLYFVGLGLAGALLAPALLFSLGIHMPLAYAWPGSGFHFGLARNPIEAWSAGFQYTFLAHSIHNALALWRGGTAASIDISTSSDPAILLQTADDYRDKENYIASIPIYQKLIEPPFSWHDRILAAYSLADIYRKVGRYRESVELIQSFIEKLNSARPAPEDDGIRNQAGAPALLPMLYFLQAESYEGLLKNTDAARVEERGKILEQTLRAFMASRQKAYDHLKKVNNRLGQELTVIDEKVINYYVRASVQLAHALIDETGDVDAADKHLEQARKYVKYSTLIYSNKDHFFELLFDTKLRRLSDPLRLQNACQVCQEVIDMVRRDRANVDEDDPELKKEIDEALDEMEARNILKLIHILIWDLHEFAQANKWMRDLVRLQITPKQNVEMVIHLGWSAYYSSNFPIASRILAQINNPLEPGGSADVMSMQTLRALIGARETAKTTDGLKIAAERLWLFLYWAKITEGIPETPQNATELRASLKWAIEHIGQNRGRAEIRENPRVLGELLLTAGELAAETRDFDLAERALTLASEIDPDSRKQFYLAALKAAKSGKPEDKENLGKAKSLFRKEWARDPIDQKTLDDSDKPADPGTADERTAADNPFHWAVNFAAMTRDFFKGANEVKGFMKDRYRMDLGDDQLGLELAEKLNSLAHPNSDRPGADGKYVRDFSRLTDIFPLSEFLNQSRLKIVTALLHSPRQQHSGIAFILAPAISNAGRGLPLAMDIKETLSGSPLKREAVNALAAQAAAKIRGGVPDDEVLDFVKMQSGYQRPLASVRDLQARDRWNEDDKEHQTLREWFAYRLYTVLWVPAREIIFSVYHPKNSPDYRWSDRTKWILIFYPVLATNIALIFWVAGARVPYPVSFLIGAVPLIAYWALRSSHKFSRAHFVDHEYQHAVLRRIGFILTLALWTPFVLYLAGIPHLSFIHSLPYAGHVPGWANAILSGALLNISLHALWNALALWKGWTVASTNDRKTDLNGRDPVWALRGLFNRRSLGSRKLLRPTAVTFDQEKQLSDLGFSPETSRAERLGTFNNVASDYLIDAKKNPSMIRAVQSDNNQIRVTLTSPIQFENHVFSVLNFDLRFTRDNSDKLGKLIDSLSAFAQMNIKNKPALIGTLQTALHAGHIGVAENSDLPVTMKLQNASAKMRLIDKVTSSNNPMTKKLYAVDIPAWQEWLMTEEEHFEETRRIQQGRRSPEERERAIAPEQNQKLQFLDTFLTELEKIESHWSSDGLEQADRLNTIFGDILRPANIKFPSMKTMANDISRLKAKINKLRNKPERPVNDYLSLLDDLYQIMTQTTKSLALLELLSDENVTRTRIPSDMRWIASKIFLQRVLYRSAHKQMAEAAIMTGLMSYSEIGDRMQLGTKAQINEDPDDYNPDSVVESMKRLLVEMEKAGAGYLPDSPIAIYYEELIREAEGIAEMRGNDLETHLKIFFAKLSEMTTDELNMFKIDAGSRFPQQEKPWHRPLIAASRQVFEAVGLKNIDVEEYFDPDHILKSLEERRHLENEGLFEEGDWKIKYQGNDIDYYEVTAHGKRAVFVATDSGIAGEVRRLMTPNSETTEFSRTVDHDRRKNPASWQIFLVGKHPEPESDMSRGSGIEIFPEAYEILAKNYKDKELSLKDLALITLMTGLSASLEIDDLLTLKRDRLEQASRASSFVLSHMGLNPLELEAAVRILREIQTRKLTDEEIESALNALDLWDQRVNGVHAKVVKAALSKNYPNLLIIVSKECIAAYVKTGNIAEYTAEYAKKRRARAENLLRRYLGNTPTSEFASIAFDWSKSKGEQFHKRYTIFGAGAWEWIFQAPVFVTLALGIPALWVVAVAVASSFVFSGVHKGKDGIRHFKNPIRAIQTSRFWVLIGIGIGLSAAFVAPALAFSSAFNHHPILSGLSGLVLNYVSHASWNALALWKGWTVASILDRTGPPDIYEARTDIGAFLEMGQNAFRWASRDFIFSRDSRLSPASIHHFSEICKPTKIEPNIPPELFRDGKELDKSFMEQIWKERLALALTRYPEHDLRRIPLDAQAKVTVLIGLLLAEGKYSEIQSFLEPSFIEILNHLNMDQARKNYVDRNAGAADYASELQNMALLAGADMGGQETAKTFEEIFPAVKAGDRGRSIIRPDARYSVMGDAILNMVLYRILWKKTRKNLSMIANLSLNGSFRSNAFLAAKLLKLLENADIHHYGYSNSHQPMLHQHDLGSIYEALVAAVYDLNGGGEEGLQKAEEFVERTLEIDAAIAVKVKVHGQTPDHAERNDLSGDSRAVLTANEILRTLSPETSVDNGAMEALLAAKRAYNLFKLYCVLIQSRKSGAGVQTLNDLKALYDKIKDDAVSKHEDFTQEYIQAYFNPAEERESEFFEEEEDLGPDPVVLEITASMAEISRGMDLAMEAHARNNADEFSAAAVPLGALMNGLMARCDAEFGRSDSLDLALVEASVRLGDMASSLDQAKKDLMPEMVRHVAFEQGAVLHTALDSDSQEIRDAAMKELVSAVMRKFPCLSDLRDDIELFIADEGKTWEEQMLANAGTFPAAKEAEPVGKFVVNGKDPAAVLREMFKRRASGSRVYVTPVSLTRKDDDRLAALGFVSDTSRDQLLERFSENAFVACRRQVRQVASFEYSGNFVTITFKKELEFDSQKFNSLSFIVLSPEASEKEKLSQRDKTVQMASFLSLIAKRAVRVNPDILLPIVFHLPDSPSRDMLIRKVNHSPIERLKRLLGSDSGAWKAWLETKEERDAKKAEPLRSSFKTMAETSSPRAKRVVEANIADFIDSMQRETKWIAEHWISQDFSLQLRTEGRPQSMEFSSLSRTFKQVRDFQAELAEVKDKATSKVCISYMQRMRTLMYDVDKALYYMKSSMAGLDETEPLHSWLGKTAAYAMMYRSILETANKRLGSKLVKSGIVPINEFIRQTDGNPPPTVNISNQKTNLPDSEKVSRLLKDLRSVLAQAHEGYLADSPVRKYYGDLIHELDKINPTADPKILDASIHDYFDQLSALMTSETMFTHADTGVHSDQTDKPWHALIVQNVKSIFEEMGWDTTIVMKYFDPENKLIAASARKTLARKGILEDGEWRVVRQANNIDCYEVRHLGKTIIIYGVKTGLDGEVNIRIDHDPDAQSNFPELNEAMNLDPQNVHILYDGKNPVADQLNFPGHLENTYTNPIVDYILLIREKTVRSQNIAIIVLAITLSMLREYVPIGNEKSRILNKTLTSLSRGFGTLGLSAKDESAGKKVFSEFKSRGITDATFMEVRGGLAKLDETVNLRHAVQLSVALEGTRSSIFIFVSKTYLNGYIRTGDIARKTADSIERRNQDIIYILKKYHSNDIMDIPSFNGSWLAPFSHPWAAFYTRWLAPLGAELLITALAGLGLPAHYSDAARAVIAAVGIFWGLHAAIWTLHALITGKGKWHTAFTSWRLWELTLETGIATFFVYHFGIASAWTLGIAALAALRHFHVNNPSVSEGNPNQTFEEDIRQIFEKADLKLNLENLGTNGKNLTTDDLKGFLSARDVVLDKKYSEEQILWMTEQALMRSLKMKPLETAVPEMNLDEKSEIDVVIDPSAKDPAAYAQRFVSNLRGKKVRFLAGKLSEKQVQSIRNLSADISIEIKQNLFESVSPGAPESVDFDVLEDLLKSGGGTSVTALFMPQRLMNVSGLNGRDPNSILRKISFVLINDNFEAARPMTFQILEHIRETAVLMIQA